MTVYPLAHVDEDCTCSENRKMLESVGLLTFAMTGANLDYHVDFKMDGELYRGIASSVCVAVNNLFKELCPVIVQVLVEERDQLRVELCQPERVTAKLFGEKEVASSSTLLPPVGEN